MGRTEIENLRVAVSMPSVSGRLTRLRMLLSALEKEEQSRSKRVCDGLRKEFHKILKTENMDNEILATAARLLLRLDRIDPFKQKTRSEKQRAQELAEQLLAPEPETPAAAPPPTPEEDPWNYLMPSK
jgi:hypothetical protein